MSQSQGQFRISFTSKSLVSLLYEVVEIFQISIDPAKYLLLHLLREATDFLEHFDLRVGVSYLLGQTRERLGCPRFSRR